MATVLHARKIDGKTIFRSWSTGSESYVSEEISEKELREYLLKEAVCEAIEQHLKDVEKRIKRTLENGTSSPIGSRQDLTGPWCEESED